MLADRLEADPLPHINMTPMVDVILCLLVFFMAATRLYDWEDEQFRVRVPEVSAAAPLTAAPDDITLEILHPGEVRIDETSYNLDTLTDYLREAKARYADQSVLIRGDAKLSYQDLADVLACCEAAEIRNVRLPVRHREAATTPTPDAGP
jgi:biopolymer transport protein ExbD